MISEYQVPHGTWKPGAAWYLETRCRMVPGNRAPNGVPESLAIEL